ncbi:MAG TPA: hypothetical protein PKZ84_00770 [Anaerolineae bacterium]|nr:hypothetical protein [Anaerolineae bacterium]HQI83169.1 hypothetical protein [Anaerolineae bacterium]
MVCDMIKTYRGSKTYPVGADILFTYCLGAVRAIGAEIESSDRELGIVHANYYLTSVFFVGQVGISMRVTQNGDSTAEVAIETYITYPNLMRLPPARKAWEVAQKIITKVSDAVALAESGKRS